MVVPAARSRATLAVRTEGEIVARAMWKGAIQFGLVTIPVKLYLATESEQAISFNMLHKKDLSRIQMKIFCPVEDEVISRTRHGPGLRVRAGPVRRDHGRGPRDACRSRPSASIEIEQFVEARGARTRDDPLREAGLLPRARPGRPQGVLPAQGRSSQDKGLTAICKVVIKDREALAALDPFANTMLLRRSTGPTRSAPLGELDLPEEEPEFKPAERKMAEQLVAAMTGEFDPAEYHDEYREALMKVIEAKVEGKRDRHAAEQAEEPANLVDLMAALEASVNAAKAARDQRQAGLGRRGQTAGEGDGRRRKTAPPQAAAKADDEAEDAESSARARSARAPDDRGRRRSAGRARRRREPARLTAMPLERVPPQARLREDARAGRRTGTGRAAPAGSSSSATGRPGSTTTSASRSTACSRQLGRAEGPDARPGRAPDGRPRRGPPDRVLRLRGRDPGEAVRRRRRDRLGLGHLGARGRDARTRRRPSPTASSSSACTARSSAGRFTIVRTSRPQGGAPRRVRGRRGEQWLLIHKRDETRSTGWDAEDHPAERQDRPDERRGQGRPRRALDQPGAGGRGRDRPVGGREPAMPAGFIEPMLATLVRSAVRRSGLAVRDQVGRLPGPGGRGRRQGADLHAQRQRRGDVLPAPARAAGPLARRRGGDRRRRGRRARRRRSAGLLAAPGPDQRRSVPATARQRTGRSRARRRLDASTRRSSTRSSTCSTSTAGRCSRSRSRSASGCSGRSSSDGSSVRFAAHVVGEGDGVLSGGRRAGPGRHRRQASSVAVRARPADLGLAQAQAPAGAGARRRRLDAGGGQRPGARRGRRRRHTTTVACGSPGKVGSGFDARARRQLRERLDALASDVVAVRPAAPGLRGAGRISRGVHWVEPRARHPGRARRLDAGTDIVRQAAFKGIDDGRDPVTVDRARSPIASSVAEAEVGLELADGEVDGEDRSRWRRTATGADMPAPTRTERHQGRERRTTSATRPEWAPATSEELAELDRLGKAGTWTRRRPELKLTNLDKVDLPAAGRADPTTAPVTKRELIRYFALIAPAMLPHLEERPLNLQRFPERRRRARASGRRTSPTDRPGLAHAAGARSGVEDRGPRTATSSPTGVATLCWLGNQAAFEIHAWTGRSTEP